MIFSAIAVDVIPFEAELIQLHFDWRGLTTDQCPWTLSKNLTEEIYLLVFYPAVDLMQNEWRVVVHQQSYLPVHRIERGSSSSLTITSLLWVWTSI